jgi:hypothetical protein
MSHLEFNAAWKRITDRYYDTVIRAEYSHYTRSTRLREQGALRRYTVELRRLRGQCGCAGCEVAS